MDGSDLSKLDVISKGPRCSCHTRHIDSENKTPENKTPEDQNLMNEDSANEENTLPSLEKYEKEGLIITYF